MPGENEVGKVRVGVEFDVSQQAKASLKKQSQAVGAQMGREIAVKQAQEYERQFQLDIAKIKEHQLRGFISPKEAAKAGRDAARDYNRAMLQVLNEGQRSGSFRGRAGQDAFERVAGSIKNVDAASRRAGLGLGRLNDSMVQVFRQASGANPTVGRLVDTIGTFAIGVGPMVAILAGLAAIAAAWAKIRGEARAAAEELRGAEEILEKAIEARELEARGGEVAVATETAQAEADRIKTEIEALERARDRLARTPAAAPGVQAGGLGAEDPSQIIDRRIASLQERYDELAEKIEEGETQAREAADEAQESTRQSEVAALAALVKANEATEAELARAREIMTSHQAEIARLAQEDPTPEVLADRQRLVAELSQLEAAFAPDPKIAQEREKAQREAAQAMEQLGRLEAEMQARLAKLTRSALDETLLALDELERSAREAAEEAGTEVSQGFIDGLNSLRETAGLEQLFLDLEDRLHAITREDSGTRDTSLDDFIVDLQETLSGLEEGTQIQHDFNRLLERAVDLQGKFTEEKERAAKAAQDELEQTQRELERAETERLRNLRDTARTIEESARGALQLAEAFGVVDDSVAQTLETIVQLGTGIARLAGGDLTAIPSVLGAAASLASKIFGGGDDEEKARREEEARALAEVAQELKRAADSLDEIAGRLTSLSPGEVGNLRSFADLTHSGGLGGIQSLRGMSPDEAAAAFGGLAGTGGGDLLEQLQRANVGFEDAAKLFGFDPDEVAKSEELMRQLQERLQQALDRAREQVQSEFGPDLEARRAALAGDETGAAQIRLAAAQAEELKQAEALAEAGFITAAQLEELKEVLAGEFTQALEDAQEAAERAAEAEARRVRSFEADISARQAALAGDDAGAFEIRLRERARAEMDAAQDLLEAGVITEQMFTDLSAVIEGEVVGALQEFAQAAEEAAAAERERRERQGRDFQTDFAVRQARLAGDDDLATQILLFADMQKQIEGAQELVDAGIISQDQFEDFVHLLEDEFVDAIGAAKEATLEMVKSMENDIAIRELLVAGRDQEAALMKLQIAHQEQLNEAIAAGMGKDFIDRLKGLQRKEVLKLQEEFSEREREADDAGFRERSAGSGRAGAIRGSRGGDTFRSVSSITFYQAHTLTDIAQAQLFVLRSIDTKIGGLRSFNPLATAPLPPSMQAAAAQTSQAPSIAPQVHIGTLNVPAGTTDPYGFGQDVGRGMVDELRTALGAEQAAYDRGRGRTRLFE